MEPVAAVGRVVPLGLHCDDKLLRLTGFPWIDEVRVPAGAFVAEDACLDAFTFGEELRLIVFRDVGAVDGIGAVAGVPHGEDDAPLGLRIDLHAEVAAREAAGHVEGVKRLLDGGDLVVEERDLFVLRRRIHQMHRGGVATRLEVEMRIQCRGPVEHEGFDEAFAALFGGQFKLRVTGFRDLEFAKRSHSIRHDGLAARFADLEAQNAAVIAFHTKARGELAGRFEVAKPRNALFRVFPAAEAFFLRKLDSAEIRVAVGGRGGNAEFSLYGRGDEEEGEKWFHFQGVDSGVK